MKKNIWIASLLTALSITAVAGGIALANNNEQPIVTQAAENWQGDELDNKYLYGTTLDVPAAAVEVNGVTVEATASVTYPNGVTVTANNVQLNQAGMYTVTYRAVVDGTHCVQEKTFSVEDKAYLVQSEKSSVEYGKYTSLGANSSGLLVRLAQGDSLTFSKLIEFDDLTASDKLFELFVTPNTRGVYDFKRLIITLTDPTDSTKYLRFQVRKYGSDTNGLATTYVDVGGNGQSQVGCESGVHRINGWGTPVNHSFSAVMNDPTVNGWSGPAVNLAPDTYKVYVTYNPENMEVKARNAHVAQLNDLAYYETIWQGFPSGKAKVTITADEYSSETANFCITSLFGIDDLSQDVFSEDEAPMVDVALTEEEMPQGEVGSEYAIPTATAYDFYAGNCDVRTSVYRDYASSSPISVGVVDGKFKPTVAGWHTIVYTAKDALGNETTVTRNVYVSADLGKIEISLPVDAVSSATLGSWVEVGNITYTGDSGFATVKKTVTLGDKTVEITDGFIPEEQGKWVVTYTVTDYIGRVGTASYEVDATPGDEYVVLDELKFPKIFVADSKYTLPVIYANDYSSGKAEKLLCDVVVTDAKGETTYKAGDEFAPSVATNGDMVKISYQCGGKELKTAEVPAVLVKGYGEIVAKNYFYGEGFKTSYKDREGEWYPGGIEIIAEEASALCGWTFATPQLASEFEIELESMANYTKFDALVVTLTDSVNENEKISITIKVKKIGSTVTVGDTSLDMTGTSLSSGGKYKVLYDDGKFTFDGTSFAVDKTVNGEAFTGFSSNFMYVSVDMVNVSPDASYKVLSISKSNISRRNLDVFHPTFKIMGDFGGNQSLNATYEIFPAIAGDAFAPSTSLTLTLVAPDGSIVTDNNGLKLENVATDKSYFVTLSQYGKYQVTYSMVEQDWVVENALNLVKSIFVIDEVAPQAAFVNATQTTAKVGDTIVMPDVVYQDNITLNENMQVERGVYSPTGTFYLFKDGENAIKCAYAGEYKFIAIVMDEFGNMKSVTHVVTVTQ